VLDLKPEYVECRDIGHAWFKAKSPPKGKKALLHAGPGLRLRMFECPRCTTWKEDLVVYRSGERFGTARYHWPEGYLLTADARVSRTEIRRLAVRAAEAVLRKRRRRAS
jgi:hypothetical protein